eukprot:TRINITY_DN5572_c0_g1_i1.p1 TRINITY_DN5572_c0_g1~~TRINITY_DN5572_c0_g1_i1.p1  ORF type:complete len:290 (-),score=21.64 TRINITY_DN5572_c0_g1_i1:166-1035(-)
MMEEEKYSTPKMKKTRSTTTRVKWVFEESSPFFDDRCEESLKPSSSTTVGSCFTQCLNSLEASPNTHMRPTTIDIPRTLALRTETDYRHPGINTISAETVYNLLTNNNHGLNFLIIDCRFPYEFDAGHIQSAINVYLPNHLQEFLFEWEDHLRLNSFLAFLKEFGSIPTRSQINKFFSATFEQSPSEPIIILHCEFSQSRSPKMWRSIRNLDRESCPYPTLRYPNIYLMKDGYANFWKNYPDSCQGTYVSMFDKRHRIERKEFEEELQSQAYYTRSNVGDLRRSISVYN